MKPQWNKKYNTIAVYTFLVLLCVSIVIFALTKITDIRNTVSHVFDVLAPVITGVVFAYLLNPVLDFFEFRVFRKVNAKQKYSKARRGLSLFSTCLCVLIVLALIVMLLVPQLMESYNSLMNTFGSVDAVVESIVNSVKNNEFFSQNYATILRILGIDPENEESELITKVSGIIMQYMPVVLAWLKGVVNGVYNALIAFIFCIYVLAYREKLTATIRKIFTSVLSKNNYDRFGHVLSITDKNFGGFIKGKILDSCIIFVIAYAVYMFMGLKFYPILAFITGVTNVIPFFGPFIGAVPVGVIVLIAQPEKLIWTLLAILLIQQLDGNLIGPMILGDSVGISPVWIISSILVFGGLFGFFGMLFGVPLFATIYAIIKESVENSLEKKNLPVDTKAYYVFEDHPSGSMLHKPNFEGAKKVIEVIKKEHANHRKHDLYDVGCNAGDSVKPEDENGHDGEEN